MVSSGTELEVLERDGDSGYTRVRTPGGTEGWVLTRYLMNEASAREQLQALSAQLSSANTLGSSLDTQLSSIRGEYQGAQSQIQALEREKATLEQELAEIRRTAANVLAINEDNTRLREQLLNTDIRVDTLEEENRRLSSQTNYYWFVAGAGVLIFGALMGLILPRFKWRRRSRYDRL
jgi:SH3 domain protein